MRHRFGRVAAATTMIVASGCGGSAVEPEVPVAAAAKVRAPAYVTPAALIPELDPKSLEPWLEEEGIDRYLVGGLRIARRADGQVTRANERFPSGAVQPVRLPLRLGGGYLFYQADGQGTRLWRAPSWTAALTPLGFIGPTAVEVIPGFDRLYLRTNGSRVFAMDAEDGALLPLGPLPMTGDLGQMVFADAWRGVVDLDLYGPVATFDAGETWRPLAIAEGVEGTAVVGGDPVLFVAEGYYRIDGRGHVQHVRHDAGAIDDTQGHESPARPPARGRLQAGDFRTFILRGFPESKDRALVLHGGALHRVTLPEGEVVGVDREALDDEAAECVGAPVGDGIGFICGRENGPTTVHRFRPPLALDTVATFPEPRFVSPGGTGALAVRGPCGAPRADVGDDTLTYCIVDKGGATREIAVKGEIGAERVVALDDGRVVVLVPPRLGRPGRITIIDGTALSSKELTYPDQARRATKVARQGMWLEGFQQQGKNAVAGWVEAGGPTVGVTVSLDGKVKVGELLDASTDVLVSGRLGLAMTDGEDAYETVDGGASWTEIELPPLPSSQGDPRTRHCGRLGCALRGWLRLGWGKPRVKHDLAVVDLPPSRSIRPVAPNAASLECSVVAQPAAAVNASRGGEHSPFSSWLAFRGTEPPKLGKDELGVDKGSAQFDPVPAHVYVWGPRGADWTKAGFWQVRFDDRFRVSDHVRSSAPTRSIWGDEASAADGIGARHQGSYWRWDAIMDPGGEAAIANLCTGATCIPYSVVEGSAVAQLQPATSPMAQHKPLPQGAVRVGEGWYLLTQTPGAQALTLWRATLGEMEPWAQFRRIEQRFLAAASPRLVRRALGRGLGIVVVEPADPATGSSEGRYRLYPIEEATGRAPELAPPIDLGPVAIDEDSLRPCADHEDGFVMIVEPSQAPVLRFVGARGYAEDFELRMRMSATGRCVDAAAALVGSGGLHVSEEAKAASGFGLSLRERYDGRRWGLRCRAL